MTTIQDITLAVPDVSCEHCVKAINGALEQQSGIRSVQVDLSTKTVHLQYDPDQISVEEIEVVLDDTGYTVTKQTV